MYTEKFYSRLDRAAQASIRHMVPLILELIDPKSVVDLGCGTGRWLAEFRRCGLDVLGIDSENLPLEKLAIPRENFLVWDLTQRICLERRFNLAISLEVAEHLPETSADDFVASLTSLAPVVVFSAAIPWQSGTGHINLQWPEYWAGKFAAHDYVAIDSLRRKLWKEKEVSSWYRQNTLVYASRNHLQEGTRLHDEYLRTSADQLDLVHPEVYLKKAWPSLKRTWKLFRARLRASLRRDTAEGSRERSGTREVGEEPKEGEPSAPVG